MAREAARARRHGRRGWEGASGLGTLVQVSVALPAQGRASRPAQRPAGKEALPVEVWKQLWWPSRVRL